MWSRTDDLIGHRDTENAGQNGKGTVILSDRPSPLGAKNLNGQGDPSVASGTETPSG